MLSMSIPPRHPGANLKGVFLREKRARNQYACPTRRSCMHQNEDIHRLYIVGARADGKPTCTGKPTSIARPTM